jgi:hypothetical protein
MAILTSNYGIRKENFIKKYSKVCKNKKEKKIVKTKIIITFEGFID